MEDVLLTPFQEEALLRMYKIFIREEGASDRVEVFYDDLPRNTGQQLEKMGFAVNSRQTAYYRNKNCVMLTPKGLEVAAVLAKRWAKKYKDGYRCDSLCWNDLPSAEQNMLNAIGLLGQGKGVSVTKEYANTQVCVKLERKHLITITEEGENSMICTLSPCGMDMYYNKKIDI